ncbi:MAG: aminopeptidase [Clostridia bacterium]|nr:aminopeptidase [Clostridia bacterium]
MKNLKSSYLAEFSALVLKFGVNLQKGQGLEIACPVECEKTARAMTKVAYEMGASIVRIRWENDATDRLNLLYADKRALTDVPKWFVDSKNDLVKKNFCYVAIAAEDPSAFKGIPDDRLAAYSLARRKALKKFSEKVMANGIRWCVVSVPTAKWAKQVFPDSKNPLHDLNEAIKKTMRLDKENPEKEWDEHIFTLSKRANFLTNCDFDYLHFENSIGTDLKVGLADGHVWLSAKEKAEDGVEFIANMPTEEVFTAPHLKRVEGKVFSALPLSYNGQIIDGFSLEFKEGKIVNFAAKKGYSALKSLIETDEGTLRLGEVALIGKNSPIAQSGILFYNTLFDENASCHIAIGKGYPTTIKGGENLSKDELLSRGVNDSVEHVDFMIGTPDLKVTGVKKSGEKVTLFIDGEWAI